jgi:putative glutamine amidotransferase
MSAPSDAPVIGICPVREQARWSFWDQPAHLVADSYVGGVRRAGGLPVLLPVDPRAPARAVEAIDGLLLIGGADVDPASYGAKPQRGLETTHRDRDDFEIGSVRHALAANLPVLAICRGMQILNVALGGTLLQDLTDENGETIHRRRKGTFAEAENHVELEEGSLAARSAGEGVHVAHCHHHQAIDGLGQGLNVTGRALEDGLPEAIETTDGRWVLGVQWHPEARDESAVLTAFVAAAREVAVTSRARGTPSAPSPSRGRRSAGARSGA